MRFFRISVTVVACLSILNLGSADDEVTLTGSVSPQDGLSRVRILLNGGAFSAFPNADGSFEIPSLPIGSYLLEVNHPFLQYDPVLVEVSAGGRQGEATVSAFLLSFEHGKGKKLKYPLGLASHAEVKYFQKREEFNIFVLFKNPMVLMGLVSFGLLFILPKMQQGIDPEALQELQPGSQGANQSGEGGQRGYESRFLSTALEGVREGTTTSRGQPAASASSSRASALEGRDSGVPQQRRGGGAGGGGGAGRTGT
ncbi:unnamed protein product [Vitrella brassicaformis CCMP3155]|uniref:ER membrane protein complex subunit 7 beta-sandwich domain-containing protein n=1 Tax=Vitrella brassicaformis (strain CCMP3155) TaxID=1169540 RepID=A0A0G4FQ17_VITBC|nr:unnamed protein product [Vitrella brassicaformis CCMP3155]|eukprot:CEM16361.1 unnamed protein product [Vitrella brassicaformis CCMP3155]